MTHNGSYMLTVAEAHDRIANCVRPLPPRRLRLSELLNLRLAEDVVSQVDSPPFDKSQVDGYAIARAIQARRSASWN